MLLNEEQTKNLMPTDKTFVFTADIENIKTKQEVERIIDLNESYLEVYEFDIIKNIKEVKALK